VNLVIVVSVFPLVFLGELPDKTMFASLVLASRGRPGATWVGAAIAFTIHVAIAVTAGEVVFHLVPRRGVDAIVAALFAVGAIYAWRTRERPASEARVADVIGRGRTIVTATAAIFIAEWGDLTQVITANLALHYHSPASVALGSLLALLSVAGIAVSLGPRIVAHLPPKGARMLSAGILAALSIWSIIEAVRL